MAAARETAVASVRLLSFQTSEPLGDLFYCEQELIAIDFLLTQHPHTASGDGHAMSNSSRHTGKVKPAELSHHLELL